MFQHRPYYRCLADGSCGREAGETAGFLSGGSINYINNPSSLILYILYSKVLKDLERKVQCIPLIEYSKKRKKSSEGNGGNEYQGNERIQTVLHCESEIRREREKETGEDKRSRRGKQRSCAISHFVYRKKSSDVFVFINCAWII